MGLQNNKKTKLIILSVLVVVVLGILLAIYVIHGFSTVTTDDAYIAGRIHSIASKIPGTVKRVLINDNQGIKNGDVLVEIDPLDYEARLREAQAAVEAEKARLLDSEAGIKAAAANLEMQEATLNQAKLDKNRADALYQENVIPKERHEKIMTAFDLALAQMKASREQLEKAKSTRELQKASVRQKEAALDIAKLNLSYTKIIAPCDGYITSKSVETGNQVQVGQPLMALVALDDIWLVANYKETQLKRVKPGQPVEVKVDSYPGRIFTAKVDSIMAGTGAVFSLFPPENALGNYVKVVQRVPIKIVFDKTTDTRHVLRIGMSCIPSIITKDE